MFVVQNGREPKIWLDKFYINQNDIVNDLRCLPIFLAGCKHMLVLIGPTYLNRLWCVVELFTFIHMGLEVDAITMKQVLREGSEDLDAAATNQSAVNFDANQCNCFLRKDLD